MTEQDPAPVAARHPLPQGERGRLRTLAEVAKEQQERRRNQPSPLAGEGAPQGRERGLTAEEFAKVKAKSLRRTMTDAETKLWQELRARRFEDFKFRRQMAVGRYIVDFVCLSHRVIVEVDGSQHDASAHDALRDAWLKSEGFTIVRLWNAGVLQDMDGALMTVLDTLRNPAPAAARHPLPQGERAGGQ
jgi:very-short-patch-repair endonuclease